MAQPTTLSWTKFIILLGDGGGTEVFTAPCALTTKGIAFSADTADANVPDCDTPDAPTWVQRTVRGLSGEVSGGGVMAMESSDEWRLWFLSGLKKNIRVKLDTTSASNGGHFSMAAVLTGFNVSGNEDDGKIRVEVTMLTDGAVTWTAAT